MEQVLVQPHIGVLCLWLKACSVLWVEVSLLDYWKYFLWPLNTYQHRKSEAEFIGISVVQWQANLRQVKLKAFIVLVHLRQTNWQTYILMRQFMCVYFKEESRPGRMLEDVWRRMEFWRWGTSIQTYGRMINLGSMVILDNDWKKERKTDTPDAQLSKGLTENNSNNCRTLDNAHNFIHMFTYTKRVFGQVLEVSVSWGISGND